jgi:hypothetical protein
VPDLINSIKKTINSQDFIARHRRSPKDFTRNRCLTFSRLIVFLTQFLRSSIQNELDHFFKRLSEKKSLHKKIDDSSFFHARKKLKSSAFEELNQNSVSYFEINGNPKKWNGFRLCAIDGSTLRLPGTDEAREHFGVCKSRHGTSCAKARISQAMDPLNHITYHSILSPYRIGERQLAAEHVKVLPINSLTLFDRGYPAFWLFQLWIQEKKQFCARLPIDSWTAKLRLFLKSGKNEDLIILHSSALSEKQCQEKGLKNTPIELRVIKITLPTGKKEILITSLTDFETYPYSLFYELYQLRWQSEENYKRLKSRIEIENFSGKSVQAIYQDFYARTFLANLTTFLALPIQNKIKNKYKNRKYQYQINWTQAYAKIKEIGTGVLFFRNMKRVIRILQALFINNVCPIRPGRSKPRKHNPSRKRLFHFAYKPIA